MNNPLGIVVHALPGPLPAGAIVPAAELARRQDHAAVRDTLLAAARAEADALREAGATALAQAQEAAEQVRAAARDEADALGRQAKAQAIDEALQWLCAEHVLAQRLAAELAQRWRGLTAQVLDEVLGQRDLNERVLHHVEQRVAELLPQGRLTLAVAPEALAQATQAWAGTPALSLVADAALGPGQARLENARLRLHLDAPAHQAALLAHFAQAPAYDAAALGADPDAEAEPAPAPAPDGDSEGGLDVDLDGEGGLDVDLDGEGGLDVDVGGEGGLNVDLDGEGGLDVEVDGDFDLDFDFDAALDAHPDAISPLALTARPTRNEFAAPGLLEAAPSYPATWLKDFADDPWEVTHD
ncbi:FliH/SctL family protein [Pandoraea sputorum]|uniref:Type III secretion system apparatus protein n=1 Tax=Pandoraea sputorum TaxID=93222 RepID=A0A5E5BK95_9BURK|nr:hypothetical protein [Pandoraea sputorum]VVE85686.1 hypothetical protein PSP31121_05358 [Pandoraea sputorum]